MSLAEIQHEVALLSAADLKALRDIIEERLAQENVTNLCEDPTQYMGSLKGTVTYAPDWNEPEPLETWEAYRDVPL